MGGAYKTYEAEWTTTWVHTIGSTVPSIREAQATVDRILSRHGLSPIEVRRKRESKASRATRRQSGIYYWPHGDQPGRIAITAHACLALVWHEAAHAIAYQLDGHRGHGRAFKLRAVEVVADEGHPRLAAQLAQAWRLRLPSILDQRLHPAPAGSTFAFDSSSTTTTQPKTGATMSTATITRDATLTWTKVERGTYEAIVQTGEVEGDGNPVVARYEVTSERPGGQEGKGPWTWIAVFPDGTRYADVGSYANGKAACHAHLHGEELPPLIDRGARKTAKAKANPDEAAVVKLTRRQHDELDARLDEALDKLGATYTTTALTIPAGTTKRQKLTRLVAAEVKAAKDDANATKIWQGIAEKVAAAIG